MAFVCPFTLVISLVFLFGGMGVWKIQKKYLYLMRYCWYSSEAWAEAYHDVVNMCRLDAEKMHKACGDAACETFQTKFVMLCCIVGSLTMNSQIWRDDFTH
jgi:hypothetical protein